MEILKTKAISTTIDEVKLEPKGFVSKTLSELGSMQIEQDAL